MVKVSKSKCPNGPLLKTASHVLLTKSIHLVCIQICRIFVCFLICAVTDFYCGDINNYPELCARIDIITACTLCARSRMVQEEPPVFVGENGDNVIWRGTTFGVHFGPKTFEWKSQE